MRYAIARFNEEQREIVYRIYITDALKIIGRLDKRYADFIADDLTPNKKTYTKEDAQAIIDKICDGLAMFEENDEENEDGKEEE